MTQQVHRDAPAIENPFLCTETGIQALDELDSSRVPGKLGSNAYGCMVVARGCICSLPQ